MNHNLFIIARISPKTEFFEQAKQAILSIVANTLEEEGCLQFTVHEDGESLFLYEEWRNQDDLERHYAMPYIAPIFEAYQEWLKGPVEINKLKRLA
ncbi:putative quinol monooxygenase [Microbulbifer sp. GL-2]|uniref:putative quinol monooxygenase n=1 Tax=Microbulbifer sp. GL-2 TaxID=2591606 RepID=UPI001165B7B3|nr:putative quinol monooxygenase [Microbulbifer sp. GL-2]BBM01097.1 antibiotic biosynthesis monooxygenase [Microbulbifer sp. GL-2]